MKTSNASHKGKVAFVTGAANGIGRAAALAFAREGASVVVTDVSEQGNQETARLIERLGVPALAVRCDVSQADQVKAALDKTSETFGRLDFAFNNAGVEQPITATADLTEDEWDRIARINLRGVFLCMKYEIPLMLKNGGGVIVNTSSGAGVKGIKGQAAYCAAKHGVIGLTKAAALDYACTIKNPHQRRVSWNYRHADDAAVHRRHSRGRTESHRARANRQNGNARRNCRRRRMVVFGFSSVRHRSRNGH